MAIKQLVSSFTRLVLPLCVLVLLLGVPSHRAEAQCTTSTACVDSVDIVNGSIRRIDIAPDAIGSAQLGPASVGTSELGLGVVQQAQMAAESVGTAQIVRNAVGTQQIDTGAVRAPNIAFGAVGTAQIAPRSVTEQQLGPASVGEEQLQELSVGPRQLRPRAVGQSEIDLGAVGGPQVQLNSLTEQHFSVANRRVVAKVGGDFTSISAALAKLNPSASTRFVIDVMPGTYVENITMKSFVHLRGAGRDLVHIVHHPDCGFCNVIQMIDTERVEISGITVRGAPEGASGIYIEGGHDQTIHGNRIILNGLGGAGARGFGIYARRAGGVKIIDNEINENGCTGIGIEESGPYILRNFFGFQDPHCNQGGPQDVSIVSGGGFISFNVLQSIVGVGGSGRFNLTLEGIPVDVP